MEEAANPLYEHHRWQVDPGQSAMRLDKYIVSKLGPVSRAKVQGAMEAGYVLVDGHPCKANQKVQPGQEITVWLPEPPRDNDIQPEDLPLDIHYEDQELLVVYKPAGMVVHPAHENRHGTLVNALLHHFQNLPTHRNGEGRPGLVHRIDKDTSGLLVIAKTEAAMACLARQFEAHSVGRTYQALVWGEPHPPAGTIEAPLGRSPKDRRVTIAFPEGDHGRRAITHYRSLEALHYVSLVECRLETGRTHQIRAHMKYLGHPLFNDALYGGDRILKGTVFSKYKQFVENAFKCCPRQALHAKTLSFTHPDGHRLAFDTPLPADMAQLLEKWRRYANPQN